MKLARLLMIGASVSLVACAGIQKVEAPPPQPQPLPVAQPVAAPAPPSHPYALPTRINKVTEPVPIVAPTAPSWFLRLPTNTEDMIFAVGTASSTSEQMAFDKARMFAEARLIELLGSQISSKTMMNRVGVRDKATDRFESQIQKNAQGELVGAERVDAQSTHNGRVYKVYVLLRYPLGEANMLVRERNNQLNMRGAKPDSDVEENDPELKPTLIPEKTGATVGAVTQGQAAEIKLLNVDNEEYKRRRDEALQKPGAVLGQITVQ